MSEESDRLKALISAVEIAQVRLVEVSASTTIRSPDEIGTATFQVKTSSKISEHLEDGTFFVLATIDAKLLPTEFKESDPPSVWVRAGFELQYKLPTQFPTSASDLSAFAEVNAVFNAWPYWREIIQNTFSRMSLPPVILPLFRVGGLIQHEKKSP